MPSPCRPPCHNRARRAASTLQSYADKLAADTGRPHGIWLDGTLVGGVMFVRFDSRAGNCEIGVWAEPAGEGQGVQLDGVLRSDYLHNGVRHDSEVWSLLAEEWSGSDF